MSFSFRRFCHGIIPFVFLFCFSAKAIDCEKAFIKGSRLDYELRQAERRSESEQAFPTNTDPRIDRFKERKYWNEEPKTPKLLKAFLPADVHFLKYQQYEPSAPAVIKFNEAGNSLIVRAHYNHNNQAYSTNVVFSRRALLDNMKEENNWLVGSEARVAILFLHGGGTKTTGAHVARTMVNHFSDLQVDVVAIDLPWHNQGHRRYVDFETEIKILGSFAKKFIPPNVPLFVWGHSYGSVFADQLRMMTDRTDPQYKDFFFHNSLTGVFIMSTAVDPAPGKSPQEKLNALHTIKEDVDTNRFSESAPVEQQVHRNIVAEGKMSPLGSFAAMLNLMQLDQTLPSHKGAKWIPGQMTVGIHDLLVYIGYESQYKTYKNQENMETHYLDTAPHLTDIRGPKKEVGHLLGDYLDPQTNKPINFVNASNFIEAQLQISNIRDFVADQLHISLIDASHKRHILQNLNQKHFLKDIEEFFQNDQRARRLEPEIITHIQEFINTQPETPILNKNKEVIPDYLYIVQEFANNLAFRDFLAEARVFEEKKTANISRFIAERTDLQKTMGEIIQPYNTFQSRVFHFLETIIINNPLNRIEALKLEANYITGDVLSKSSIHNSAFKQDLLELKDLLSPPDLRSPLSHLSNNEVRALTEKAKEIMEKYENLWPTQEILSNHPPKKHKIPPILKKILSTRNLEDALEVLETENLPRRAIDQLKPLLERRFEVENIIRGQYVPNLEMLKQMILIPEGKEEKVEKIQKRVERIQGSVERIHSTLVSNAQKIQELTRELTKLSTEEKQLIVEYTQLLNTVKIHIKTIRETLEKAAVDTPPPSLRTEYQESQKKFEELIQAQWKMEQLLDKIAVKVLDSSVRNPITVNQTQTQSDNFPSTNRNPFSSQNEIDNILRENHEIIEHVSDLFSRYVRFRRELRRNTITAIEKGELGQSVEKDPQEAVIAIFGPNSQGKRPRVGIDTFYSNLEKTILALAELEAKKRHTNELLILAKRSYKNEMNSLISLLGSNTQKSEELIAQLTQANNIVNISSTPISNVLSGDAMINTKDFAHELSSHSIANYLNQTARQFKNVFKQWNDLKSSLPPILPTE